MSQVLVANNGPVIGQCCDKCQELLREIAEHEAPGTRERTTILFHSIQTLISSADDCHLCNLILSELDPEVVQYQLDDIILHPEHALNQMTAIIPPYGRSGATSYNTVAVLQESHLREGIANHIPLCYLVTKSPESSVTARQVAPTTASFETSSDIHHWIRTCGTGHLNCIQRLSGYQFQRPTRLLYVGTFEPQPLVQLRELGEIPQHAKYVTLSHCWGPNMNFKLVPDEYDRFRSGFRLNELPTTFRDAVVLTRCLGLEYLWIDSMCIIQTEAEWEKEALLMKDVYRGSFLNIAANAYFTPNGGLFQKRSPSAVAPLNVDLTLHGSGSTVILFPKDEGMGHLQSAPLSTRAWTVQERLLAPRTIHFLRHKVMWECSSVLSSESDPTGVLEVQSGAADVIRGWALISESDGVPRAIRCLSKWYQAVRLYTHGELTFQTDRLIAVAGIAACVKDLWRDESITYLAGLWSYQLAWSLLWHVPETTGVADSRAPSWSWASVRGEVFTYFLFPNENFESLIRVVEVETDLIHDSDPFGPVRGGHLRVEGPMCAVTLRNESDAETPQLFLGDRPLEFSESYFDNEASLRRDTSHSDTLFLLGVTQCLDLTMLPLRGLILQPTRKTDGEYIRVGYWSTSLDETSYNLIQDEFRSKRLDPKQFESRHIGAYIYGIVYEINII